jgi:hypothetical protein
MKKSLNTAQNKLAKRLLATAIHEAGHALAFYRLDFRLKQVSIVPKDDSLGHARSDLGLSIARLGLESPDSKTIARWHDRVVCLFAGGEAERLLGPKRLSPGILRGDLEGVKNVLWRLHPTNELPLVFRYLRIRAQNLVSRPINRQLILDLAHVLVRRRSLTGAEVLSVFRASIRHQVEERQEARRELGSKTSTSGSS